MTTSGGSSPTLMSWAALTSVAAMAFMKTMSEPEEPCDVITYGLFAG
jgi:hypothetical protein